MFFTLALLACTPEPASIKFEGADSITVNTLDAVDVSKATVLDKDGKALDPQPAITWSVTPATVAKLDGAKVTPVASGEAKVEAKVGEVKGAYKFVVALPDKLEIAGYVVTESVALFVPLKSLLFVTLVFPVLTFNLILPDLRNLDLSSQVVTEDSLSAIFQNIEKIEHIHKELLASLQTRQLEQWLSMHVGDLFSHLLVPRLELYTRYADGLGNAIMCLQVYMNMKG